MKVSSVNEIKKELEQHTSAELLGICLRLIKFKKENKELVTFLLFNATDVPSYIEEVKGETKQMFEEINRQHLFYLKKSVRKILRFINKHTKFAASKTADAEIRIHFCNCILQYDIPLKKSKQLEQLYQKQIKKIEEIISSLHPDMQYDLKKLLLN